MEYAKRFSRISELDEEKQNKFKNFKRLNIILENNPIIQTQEIFNSYTMIILKEWEISNYTELDFQIKYLIEELNISINSILEFTWEKFYNIKDVINNYFIKKIRFDKEKIDNIIDDIYSKKVWKFHIKFIYNNEDSEFTVIDFNINWDLKKFEEKLDWFFRNINLIELLTKKIKWIEIRVS